MALLLLSVLLVEFWAAKDILSIYLLAGPPIENGDFSDYLFSCGRSGRNSPDASIHATDEFFRLCAANPDVRGRSQRPAHHDRGDRRRIRRLAGSPAKSREHLDPGGISLGRSRALRRAETGQESGENSSRRRRAADRAGFRAR